MLAVDLTERYSELQVKMADEKASTSAAALEAKRAIVRHIAHEVRGPLNTIAIAGDILGQELAVFPNVPQLVHEIVDSLKESSSTAMEQINEMMLFEKVGLANVRGFSLPRLRGFSSSFFFPCMRCHFFFP